VPILFYNTLLKTAFKTFNLSALAYLCKQKKAGPKTRFLLKMKRSSFF
jgi:hypothetical protein